MRFLRRAGLHGVLADDMGLGKTHQCMALLLSMYEEGAKRPSLVVCPTSVLDPWMDKMRQYAPGLRPYKYYGPDRKAEAIALPGMRVVLTTYNTMIRDIEPLMNVEWEAVVLDEAQYIKTATTQFTRAAKQLRAATRIALSGTPIENRLDELWSLMDFVLPGHLGTFEQFRKEFEIPIVKEEDGGALARLKKRIAPFKLRRVKSEVLADLPPKVEDYRFCDLTPHQQALYRALTDRQGQELIDELKNTTANVDYVGVFAALGRLKRICDHPALVLEGARTKDLQSGKFELFKEVLDEAMRSGQKVVVFTQYLEMMDILEEHLRAQRIRYAEIRGSTKDRGAAMKSFQNDPEVKVFVCSLLAGGCGIDLTSASVVIHYDRWWNAAKEDQATDRVHRIGQLRGVQVIKLVTRGTLEEKIDKMISAKGALMNSVVDVDAASFKRFSREELIELLTMPVAREVEAVGAGG
jgi:SNF2 family DNA or RNA helicase